MFSTFSGVSFRIRNLSAGSSPNDAARLADGRWTIGYGHTLSAREGATGRPEEVLDVLGIAFEGTRIERTKLHFSLEKVGGSIESVSQPNLQD